VSTLNFGELASDEHKQQQTLVTKASLFLLVGYSTAYMWQDLKSSMSHVDKKETRFRVYLGKSMPSMNDFWCLSDQPTATLLQIKKLQTFFSLCIGSKMVINY